MVTYFLKLKDSTSGQQQTNASVHGTAAAVDAVRNSSSAQATASAIARLSGVEPARTVEIPRTSATKPDINTLKLEPST